MSRTSIGVVGVLARIEALKAVKRPAFWVTTGVFFLFNAMLILGARPRTGRAPQLPEAWRGILEPAMNLGPLFLAALIILLFAPEFRWKTARQNVIDGLGKEQFYWGKVLVLASLVALFFVTPVVIGILGVVGGADGTGSPFVEPTDLNYMLGFVAALLLWGAGAFMLAALVRAAGPALGLLFLYFLIERIVVQFVQAALQVQESILDFLPGSLYNTVIDEKLYYPLELARDNAGRAERGLDPLVLPDLWVPLVAAAAYVVLFLGLAFVSMRRRDL